MGFDDMVDELESSLNEDTGKHVIRQLFDKNNGTQINLKTELDDREIALIVRMLAIAAASPYLGIYEKIARRFMELRVSKTRQGRKELIEGLKSVTDNRTGARAFSMFGSLPPRPGVFP